MTENEMIKRLLAENFELKDKLKEATENLDFWYEQAHKTEHANLIEHETAKVMENV